MSDQLLRAHQAGYVDGGIKFLPSFVKPQNCMLEEGGEDHRGGFPSRLGLLSISSVEQQTVLSPVFQDGAKGKNE